MNLSRKDLQIRYLGSYLGLLWAFIQPVIQILIFWFVFQVGFKSAPVDNYPFILWLMAAMIPWFFISDCAINTTNSIVENSYLVKKMSFQVGLLPIVKVVSAIYIHLFFIVFLMIMFLSYNYYPDLYTLQIVYYFACSVMLVLGFAWLTSSLVIFLKDIGQFVGVITQFMFWLTPIFWSMNILPEKYHKYIKLNPVYYVTEGYRGAMIDKTWFWEHPVQTLYFWLFTFVLLLTGIIVFKRLRPHFADVL
ncbi:transport permease protein [Paenibacillus curdlanolyticus]|nr:transport permease protein [Paenibacillus curdlanolyticus]